MLQLSDLQFAFNRAMVHTFNYRKLLLTFAGMLLCGLLIVFFQAASFYASGWMAMSLFFFPLFLCVGILLSTGVLLIRIYHDEIKQRDISLRDLLIYSWEVVIGASYVAIPLVLAYLILWILLGVFILLGSIPSSGEFFLSVFSFAPFLLNFAALVLGLSGYVLLFYVAPIIALKGFDREQILHTLSKRVLSDPFSNFLFGIVGALPALFFLFFLGGAISMTAAVCPECRSPTGNILQLFFTMIPFVGLLSPAVLFFFNFAAEAHVFMAKESEVKSD